MTDKYNVSMFCLYKEVGSDLLVLYNSLKGTGDIKVISKSKHILELLDKDREYFYEDDMDFKWLVDNGYMVKCDVDEKAIRDAMKAHWLEDNYLYLTIHLTQNCNFRCVYCANDFNNEAISQNTQEEIVRFIKKNIHKYAGICISWFGGEPLLEIDIIESMSEKIMSVCKKMRKCYYADITTNGFLLNQQVVEKLSKSCVREICVTLDGTKHNHDKIRRLADGKGTYEKIFSNLISIKNSQISVNVVIRINLTKENIDDFAKYYEEYNAVFGGDKRFTIYVKVVRDWGGQSIEEIRDSLITDIDLLKVYEDYAGCEKEMQLSGIFEQLEFGGMNCFAMKRNFISIYTDGSIGKCERKEKCNILGNIKGIELNSLLLDEWNGIAYRVSNECDNCEISALCFGGTCPRDKLLNKNNGCNESISYTYGLLELYAILHQKGVLQNEQ